MSGNLSGFNAEEVEPNEGFSPLPAGDYQVIITESQMKKTKDRQGQYLELKMQILNGQYQNRVIFDRLNLVNKSDVAVQIAKGTLSSICRSVNVLTPNDSSELHNKPLTASLKIRKDAEGNPQNEVKGYKPRHSGAVQQQETSTSGRVEGQLTSPF